MVNKLAAAVAVALMVGGVARSAPLATPPSNTDEPTISGTAREGETLTGTTGTWSGTTPITFAFQWRRCNSGGDNCSNRSGATNQTYTLVGGDIGHKMRIRVTATNSAGNASEESDATSEVVSGDPVNTAAPTISGTAKQNETLTANAGSWTGPGSITFKYDWRRCNTAGDSCGTVASGQTYKLAGADVGHTMRVQVKAQNSFGSTNATSAQTAVVVGLVAVPANTGAPVISGTLRDGERLTTSNGTWTNSPTSFTYRWLRCDSAGNKCGAVHSGSSYILRSGDVGRAMRSEVTARNAAGVSAAVSAPSAAVQGKGNPGEIKLPSGETSIPVEQVSAPQRLVISGLSFSPSRLTSRDVFVGRFRATDTRGFVIRGALMYVIGLPYGWIRNAPEAVTGTDGWATIQLIPTRLMPVRRAALVLFVRVRKPGDNLLAGVSNRRLVQIRIG